ncbi:MAG TPA: hypothetical protein DHV48_10505 [Prolixibacteraceae bacterium]|nr:hypothetical protein [Prolixibacteraceae bacterium]
MISLSIRYQSIPMVPLRKNINGSMPQFWAELSANQLIAVASLSQNAISELKFLNRMTGIPIRALKKLSDFERYKITENLASVLEMKAHHRFIIPELKLSKKCRLYAPQAKLKAVSFAQFIFADTYFGNYQETGNEADLNKFIASLYLKQDELFDEKHIQLRHSQIGKIDKKIRQAIVLNFQLIHEWLALAYPLIFQKNVQVVENESRNPEPISRNSSPWIKVFQNLVGDDILHDEVWAAKPVNTIFAYMTRKYKENVRMKK